MGRPDFMDCHWNSGGCVWLNRYRNMGGIEMADELKAPLPDDVAKIVRYIRCLAMPDPHDERDIPHQKELYEAADLLERLARQVPNYDGIGSLKWWKREAEQGYVEIVNRDGAIANLQAQLARQVPPDYVVVPLSRYKELTDCLEDMSSGKGGWAWEDVLDEHRAMIAAGEDNP